IYDINKNIDKENTTKVSLTTCREYDLTIIATPPSSHLFILRQFLSRSKKVIIEKPAAVSYQEYREILALANESNIFFSLHAYYGKELHLVRESDVELVNSMKHISQFFSDPYGGNKKHLGGPFWDSIYNVLSVFDHLLQGDYSLLDVSDIENCDRYFIARCVYQTHMSTNSPSLLTQYINIHWDKNINIKVSQVVSNGGVKTIDHTAQSVYDINGKDLSSLPFVNDRLSEHYAGVIEDIIKSSNNKKNLSRFARISDVVWKIISYD
ncbi:hypothetical protein BZG04_15880, partial [Salinivibrio kushneri]|uniref:Gfo/Idh/MocA family oxidoreductase n=1 Tax=Salinivibrio kushneri TaxID=1908198 RepID=UPI0009D28B92